MSREAGILMPVSSLPGPYGIGDLGETAYAFVDFLAQAGQTYWQILPLNPPNHNKSKDSPYHGGRRAALGRNRSCGLWS